MPRSRLFWRDTWRQRPRVTSKDRVFKSFEPGENDFMIGPLRGLGSTLVAIVTDTLQYPLMSVRVS
jgi:hypothetical protein